MDQKIYMVTRNFLENTLMKAKSYEKKSEFLKAKRLYLNILNVFPQNIRAMERLKLIKIDLFNPPQEEIDELIAYLNQDKFLNLTNKADAMIEQYPNSFLIYNILGLALHRQKKSKEALLMFKKAITIQPDFVDAFYNTGNVLQSENQLNDAIKFYDKALSLDPKNLHAFHKKAIALFKQGKLEQSLKVYKTCISLAPNFAAAYNNMGICLYKLGKLKEAIISYNKSLLIEPKYPSALYHKSIALFDLGKLEEAINVCKKAIFIKENYAEAHTKIGDFLQYKGDLKKAIESYKNAININPHCFETYNNLGIALHCLNRFDNAIKVFKKSIFYNPTFARAHLNLSYTLLNSGKIKEGLEEYEWRWKTDKFIKQKRYFSKPVWDGKQSLDGKTIMIWPEQGIGDTLRWSSLLPLIVSKAEHCILECQPKLFPLLKRSFPNVEIKLENKNLDKERTDFDFHLPIGSLYNCVFDNVNQNSKPNSYLKTNLDRVTFYKNRLQSLGNGPYIGISWKSSNKKLDRLKNYSNISEWAEILTLPNVTFVNLQYEDFENELSKINSELGVKFHNFDDLDHYNDIDNVAALCLALDAVVSHNNTIHLISSGVGTPTKLANWKQSSWNNCLFWPPTNNVDIFEKNTEETWGKTFGLIAEDLFKIQK